MLLRLNVIEKGPYETLKIFKSKLKNDPFTVEDKVCQLSMQVLKTCLRDVPS